jgi:hypothetical protein
MAFRMRLGGYPFNWNPDQVTVPEEKKTVAIQDTYNGSALFQWPAVLEGTQVELKWEWMELAQYNILRALYLQTEEMRWIAEVHKAFMVVPTTLDSTYFETALSEQPYRKDVTMRLSLRSATSASTTTTSA